MFLMGKSEIMIQETKAKWTLAKCLRIEKKNQTWVNDRRLDALVACVLDFQDQRTQQA